MTRQLNDNDRVRVRVLFHDARFTKRAICATTGFSMHQVKNAIRNPAVKPRSGRPPALSPEDEAALLAFVRAHPTTVPLTYASLADQCFAGKHGVYAIRSTLRRHGCTPSALRLRGKTTAEGAAAALTEATEAARAARAAAAKAKAKAATGTAGTTTTSMGTTAATTGPTELPATATAETTTSPAAPVWTMPLTALAVSALTSTEPHNDELDDEDDEMDDEDDEDEEDEENESEDEQRTPQLNAVGPPTAPQP